MPGIESEEPQSGRYVATEAGYMVPYRQEIPGTGVTFEMIPVAGGTVTMGSPESEPKRKTDEGPQRQVVVQPLWIGKYEVTWSEYKRYMEMYDLFKEFEGAGKRVVDDTNRIDAITAPTPLYEPSFTFAYGEKPRQPAVTMSHYAAKQYTKWLTGLTGQFYRLPSESEWEYACRAGTTTAYSFGDDVDELGDHAWFYDNADASMEVGQKKPNPWGLHDMHGNVAELVLDTYRAEAYETLNASLPTSAREAIQWDTKPFPHVIRGGGWEHEADQLRSAWRGGTEDWREEDPNLPKSPWWFTDSPALNVGFRVVRPLVPVHGDDRSKYWDADSSMIKTAVDIRVINGRGVYGLVDQELAEEIAEANK